MGIPLGHEHYNLEPLYLVRKLTICAAFSWKTPADYCAAWVMPLFLVPLILGGAVWAFNYRQLK
jgi:hypothetical protein